ncbi:MAG: two-component regulator propeller domain-containing protein, partial [Calditrichaceae bacterium]
MNGKLSAYYKMCSQSNNTKSSYSFFYSIFTIAVFILFTIQNIFCQIENINFQHLTTKDGLSQSSVVSIIQDTMGFMWFGTYDGLNRYDGHKFKIYRSDPRDPHSLSLNQVTSFLKDRLGRLWVGTVGGLNLYNAGKDQFIQFTSDSLRPESLSSNMIQNMVQDNYGNIWISTYGGGVNVLTADSWINDSTMNLSEIHPENVKFIHYLHDSEDPNSLASNNATAVFMDKKGTIWVGQDHGISKFNEKNKKFIHYSIPNVDNTRNICFEEDSYGSLWVGTWSSGLFRFDPNTETFDSYSPNTGDTRGISHTVIREIYEDKNHDLWVGTYGGGLHFYDRKNDKFKVFISDPNNPTSLSSNSVSAIYEDKSNMLWIGCEFAGINMFDKNYRQFHPKKIDRNKLGEMSSNSVTTIYITKSGKETYLWLGTWESGLLKINTLTNEYTVYDHDPNDPNSLSDNLIRDFAVDKDGIFWIGTNSGLNKFDWKTEKFTQFKNDPNDPGSLSADNVFSLHIDKSNTVWVGTWGGGLNKYDRKSGNFIHFRHNENDPNSISENIIWSILEDSHGDLWVGTNNAGLNRLADYKKLDKDAKFIHYISNPEDPNSLSDNKVLNMYEDGSGNLWIGTTHGLNKYIPGSDNFIHYTHDDGLAGNSIQGILEDNNHMLWISTTSGLSRFNPESETFKNYSVNNGLQNDEFGVKSSFKSKDGSLYFGGPNGFNYF